MSVRSLPNASTQRSNRNRYSDGFTVGESFSIREALSDRPARRIAVRVRRARAMSAASTMPSTAPAGPATTRPEAECDSFGTVARMASGRSHRNRSINCRTTSGRVTLSPIVTRAARQLPCSPNARAATAAA